MKRPVGVILTSIVLGLCAGLQLLMVLAMILSSFAIGKRNATAYPAGLASPSAAMVRGTMLAEGLFFLLLAAWAVLTMVGLLRLKSWARYSVLVIGGCLSALALLSLVVGALLATILTRPGVMPPTASGQQLPPYMMQSVLLFAGLFYGAMLAVGVWWLVYFNLRSVKACFAPGLPAYSAQRLIPTGEPVYMIDANTFPRMPPPVVYPPPVPYTPGRFGRVPVGVIVIAVLFLLAAAGALVDVFLPFPALVLGFMLSGIAGHLFFLALAVAMALIGWGLLRLDNRARIATYVCLAWGLVNAVLMLTPWCQHRMVAYLDQMYSRMGVSPTIPASMFMTGPMMAFSAAIWLAVAFAVWAVLHTHRAAFVPAVDAGQTKAPQ